MLVVSSADDALFDADELGLDPEEDDERELNAKFNLVYSVDGESDWTESSERVAVRTRPKHVGAGCIYCGAPTGDSDCG